MAFRATYTQKIDSDVYSWGHVDTPVKGIATGFAKTVSLPPGVTGAVPQPGQLQIVTLPQVRLVDVKLLVVQNNGDDPIYFAPAGFDPSSSSSLSAAFVCTLPVVLGPGQLHGVLGLSEKLSQIYMWSAADSELVSGNVAVDLVLGIAT